jgi:hypothetical protein
MQTKVIDFADLDAACSSCGAEALEPCRADCLGLALEAEERGLAEEAGR